MIRHVRRHFICFTMCILTGAVLLPMIALNVIPAFMSYNQNKTVLQQAVQNEIRLRSPKPSKQPDKQPLENDPFIPQTTTVVSGTTVSVSVTSTTTTTETTAGITTDAPAEQTQAPPEPAVQESHTKPAAMTTQPVMTKPAAPVLRHRMCRPNPMTRIRITHRMTIMTIHRLIRTIGIDRQNKTHGGGTSMSIITMKI